MKFIEAPRGAWKSALRRYKIRRVATMTEVAVEVEFNTVLQEEGEGRLGYLWYWCASSGERSERGFRFFGECLRDARTHGLFAPAQERASGSQR